jgi:hypothetical protein
MLVALAASLGTQITPLFNFIFNVVKPNLFIVASKHLSNFMIYKTRISYS